MSDDLLEKTDYSGELTEMLVLPESPFVGRRLDELMIEEQYRASVLSIRRQDEVLSSNIDEEILEPGDQLLLLTNEASAELLAETEDLIITDGITDDEQTEPETSQSLDPKAFVSLSILTSVVLLAGLEVLPIVIAVLAGVVAMVVSGCLTSGEAYDAVSWNIIFLLAGVIPLGGAMQQTGGADLIAAGLVASASVLPLLGVLWLTFAVTSLLANIITPVASVVLMLPVAGSAAQTLGASVYSFIITTMFAAACAFMTPIGYQTNLMVYGPGGYTFLDYVKIGGPLQLLLSVVVPIGTVILWGI
ncbi:MAG: SLC13 family permease [bacterium]